MLDSLCLPSTRSTNVGVVGFYRSDGNEKPSSSGLGPLGLRQVGVADVASAEWALPLGLRRFGCGCHWDFALPLWVCLGRWSDARSERTLLLALPLCSRRSRPTAHPTVSPLWDG